MQDPKLMPIFFATDDGYAPSLGVALESLLTNVSPDYDIRIYILTAGLSAENTEALTRIVGTRAALTFVDMKERIAAVADRLVLRDYYSSATYFRLFISELFPEYDKALYLDCDIVVNADIAALFEVPLGDRLLGAVPEDVMARVDVFGRYVEVCLGIPREEYFNAGILVMNLSAFRERHILDRFIELLSHRRFVVTQDEDYLNVLCRGDLVLLPYTWNTSPLATELTDLPAIAHYKLDRKPWHYDDIHFGECFWRYAESTPFHKGLLRAKERHGAEGARRDRECYEGLVRLAEQEIEAEPARRAEEVRRVADCMV